MKILIIFGRFFVSFILFHKCFCKDIELEMRLDEKYEEEAYVAGIGLLSVFNETKLTKSRQSFIFSTQTDAGKLVGYQLRIPIASTLKVARFAQGRRYYMRNSEIHGPITVLMHEEFDLSNLNRYLYCGKFLPSRQSFSVKIDLERILKKLFVRLLGTSTKTGEYEFKKSESTIVIMNDADIGNLIGISIRIQRDGYAEFKNVTITHNGTNNTFVINSKIDGPVTLIKLLDTYKDGCYWTTWTEIISKNKGVARQRSCFKPGVTNEKCDTCSGISEQFVINESKGINELMKIQQNHTKIEGKNVRCGSFYIVIGVLAVSVLLNFATVAAMAVLYRRRNELRKQLQI